MEHEGSLPTSQKPNNSPCMAQIDSVHAPRPISWRRILILFPHPRLGLPSGLLPQVSAPDPLYTSPHKRYMSCPSHSSLLYHPNNIR
jgi:hypothetical protein